MKLLAVVRVRGTVGVRGDVKDTLRMLYLTRTNHCTMLWENTSSLGMLTKVKDYVTWGELDEESAEKILRNRGELQGGQRLTDDYLKKNTEYKTLKAFARDLVGGKAELDDIPKLRPFFRLHPPRKGYGGIKRSVKEGGALGRRNIKALIHRMR
ncbi:MAG: 50S ribosomal protein L30 [Candidatus Hydrothermarchaeota archaeon]|jgi:large subunit ribosomal protein L30|nr:50S ribosomal protein L30 [Candidatus Hydrothermarchaeota archaeon]MDP6613220.1 50S ribosomal protein L30 [Candidatus Hydrothermarchaeota archaeon]